jgi:hypothetical protein
LWGTGENSPRPQAARLPPVTPPCTYSKNVKEDLQLTQQILETPNYGAKFQHLVFVVFEVQDENIHYEEDV